MNLKCQWTAIIGISLAYLAVSTPALMAETKSKSPLPRRSAKIYYDRINSKFRMTPVDSNFNILYQTFTDFVLGGAISYGPFSIGYETTWKQDDLPTKTRTKAQSLYLLVDIPTLRTDIYWHRFKGYNLENVDDSFTDDDARIPRKDIHSNLYGVNALWVMNPKELWISGQSDAIDVEKGFGISFMSGVRFFNGEVTAARPLAPEEYRPRFKDEQNTRGLSYRAFTHDIGGGFSYSGHVFRLGLTLAVSYGFGYTDLYGAEFAKVDIAASVGSRMGIAWSVKGFTLGFDGRFDLVPFGSKKTHFQLDREVIQTYLQYSFN